MQFCARYAVFALIVFLPLFSEPVFASSFTSYDLAQLTNQSRAFFHVRELTENALLQKAATLKAQDMAQRQYFSHVSPEGNHSWFWLDKVGYSFTYEGENLAVNFFDSKELANAWMRSEGHRENILNKHFSEIGIGLAQGKFHGKDAVYVVQFFARPASQKSLIQSAGREVRLASF